MLTAKGIDNMIGSTVAKIESGQREVKLDEAVAIAEVLGVSLESLLGSRQASLDDEVLLYLRVLRDGSQQLHADVEKISTTLSNQVTDVMLDGIPADIADAWQQIADRADSVCRDLDTVAYDLAEIADGVTEILSRRQTK